MKVCGHVGILDLRNEETIFATNRFMIYALYPEIKLSIHVLWGLKKQNVALAIGKSILTVPPQPISVNYVCNTAEGVMLMRAPAKLKQRMRARC